MPGAKEWVLQVPFTATGKCVLAPNGDTYELKGVELLIKIALELVPTPLRYYTYGETRLATAEFGDDKSNTRYELAVIYDEQGRPRTVNVSAYGHMN